MSVLITYHKFQKVSKPKPKPKSKPKTENRKPKTILITIEKNNFKDCKYFHSIKGCKNKDCKYEHVRKMIVKNIRCKYYMNGYCKLGRNCSYKHC